VSATPKITAAQRREFETELAKLESLRGGKYSDAQRAQVATIGRRMTLAQWKRAVELLLYRNSWVPTPKEVEAACAEVLEESAARSERESEEFKKREKEFAEAPRLPCPQWVKERFPNVFGRMTFQSIEESKKGEVVVELGMSVPEVDAKFEDMKKQLRRMAEDELRTKGTPIPENLKDVEL
jgi:hypothetical protein